MTIFLEDSREFRKTKSLMRLDKNKHAKSQLFLPVTHLENITLKDSIPHSHKILSFPNNVSDKENIALT